MKPFKTLIKYLVWTIKIYISTTYYCTILMQYLSGDSVCLKYLHAICLLTVLYVLYVLILELHSRYEKNAMFMNWHRRVLMWQKFPDAYIDYVFSKSKKILIIKTAHLKNNSFSFRCYFPPLLWKQSILFLNAYSLGLLFQDTSLENQT